MRAQVVCHAAQEGSTPCREYIDKKRNNIIFMYARVNPPVIAEWMNWLVWNLDT